jgi:hypothetical protein
MTDEMAEAIAKLVEFTEEKELILNEIREQHAEDFERIDYLSAEIARERKIVEDLLRQGKKTVEAAGFTFQVKPYKKTVVDRANLIQKARERGELTRLVEDFGLLYFEVNTDQLARLPSDLQSEYATFVRVEEDTPRVYMPSRFKQ